MNTVTIVYLCIAWLTGFVIGGMHQYNKGFKAGATQMYLKFEDVIKELKGEKDNEH